MRKGNLRAPGVQGSEFGVEWRRAEYPAANEEDPISIGEERHEIRDLC